MKICFRCKVEQPISDFYQHKQMGDGHLNKCKSCTKADSLKRLNEKTKDPEWAKSERDRGREKYHRLGYRDIHKPDAASKKAQSGAYKLKFPEKALSRGSIKVSRPGFHAHHWSYLPEHRKDVVWLKEKDHYTVHRFIRYDQENMAYRTLSGVLLNTRDAHISHIKDIFALNGVEPYEDTF